MPSGAPQTTQRSPRESAVLLAARALAGGAFLFAGWAKLQDIGRFNFAVNSFKLVPAPAADAITYTLPYAEMVLGAALAAGLWARIVSAAVAAQLVLFIAAILSVFARGMVIECKCFGEYDPVCEGPLGWCNVATNALLLGLAVLVAVRGPGRYTLDRAF